MEQAIPAPLSLFSACSAEKISPGMPVLSWCIRALHAEDRLHSPRIWGMMMLTFNVLQMQYVRLQGMR
ncbi:hypothetical protein C3B58_10320 [Lactonifactor longoviformis]|nr:hypothetical protein C3B58_10320 [Lactonifactor longoviformis]